MFGFSIKTFPTQLHKLNLLSLCLFVPRNHPTCQRFLTMNCVSFNISRNVLFKTIFGQRMTFNILERLFLMWTYFQTEEVLQCFFLGSSNGCQHKFACSTQFKIQLYPCIQLLSTTKRCSQKTCIQRFPTQSHPIQPSPIYRSEHSNPFHSILW